MAITQGFTDQVINPIIDGRLQMGLSQAGLAKRLGLSRQYVSRAEQGTYSSLNPALQTWVANALSISKTDVYKRYDQFQRVTRQKSADKIGAPPLERRPGDHRKGYEIFEAWRSGYWNSSLAFSIDFCVHPETVRAYEDGVRPEMPSHVRNALTDVKLMDPEVWNETVVARAT